MKDIDALIEQAVFGENEVTKEESRQSIRDMALQQGAYPASIQGLYDASGKGLYRNKTVPAINIRGITYPVARAVFRAALKDNVGALIFEIARSEIGYTLQPPGEYAACVLGAAVKEGFRGPVFIQGDHFQVNRKNYEEDAEGELNKIRQLIQDSVTAGFYNIDIDASTVVDISKEDLEEQQAENSSITADLTRFIRSIEPVGITVSVGGEIGEIGHGNSNPADLKAFMNGYGRLIGPEMKGISKISIQTGTAHGGVVLPDGSIADVSIDFDTLKELSRIAREEYGMGGAVQHGASTLPDDAFDMFPRVDTVEVHLATGFQNIIYDSPEFPDGLTKQIQERMDSKYIGEKKESDTQEQFYYKTRKKLFGDFKKELWNLPEPNFDRIMKELEDRFSLLYRKLNVVDTTDLVKKYVVG